MYAELFRHVLFPGYESVIGRGTHRFLAQYHRNQWLDADSLLRLQLEKLNALTEFCWREVPYLERRWRQAGLEPRRLQSVQELENFPILTKDEITANYFEMTSRPWRGRSMSKATGGTTGDPFRYEYSMESYARRTAVMWRGYGWAGAGLGVRTAYLWGTPPSRDFRQRWKDRAYHSAFNRRVFNAFGMTSEREVEEYARRIASYRPDVLVGYVRPVLILAQWINRTGKPVRGLRSVLTGAEALYEPERREIERAFGCPVFNTYGGREFMLIASECDQHAGLHINVDHLVVELVDPAGRGVVDQSGDVIITDLHNLAMPLVRYRNGDRATAETRACTCGRGLPMLRSVDGRILDRILTPDGRQVSGEYFVYLMLGRTAVRRYQVVQVDTDALELKVMLDGAFPQPERDQLTAKIREVVGGSMRIVIREVDAIDEPASGKRRVTVSLESYRAQRRAG